MGPPQGPEAARRNPDERVRDCQIAQAQTLQPRQEYLVQSPKATRLLAWWDARLPQIAPGPAGGTSANPTLSTTINKWP